MATAAKPAERRDALVERLFMDAIGAFDLLSVYLGDVLGLYRTLADKGPLTSAELADAAGIHERYAREWLEHQAASGLLELEPNGDDRRYRLPRGPRRGAARFVEPELHRPAGPRRGRRGQAARGAARGLQHR
jgi:hypothetical protein